MKILVIEDDLKVAHHLKRGLTEDGYEVHHADHGAAGLQHLEQYACDLVLLDLGLPDQDGLEVLRCLRRDNPNCPVIILTARDPLADRVAGLDLGANDYVLKPYDFPELLARIRVQLRQRTPPDNVLFQIADLEVDLLKRRVRRAGEVIELTPREFDLLSALARAQGKVVSRGQLAKEVWQATRRMTSLDNLIDVHISRLREHIDKDRTPKLIHTVRGVGHTLRLPETP